MHYLLMTAVALTCVAAFEAVGAILVVAFLIIPAATAALITQRLSSMIRCSVLVGVVTAVTGYGLAREELLDCSVAGGMATMAGLIFFVVWIVAPRGGLLAQARRRCQRL
jgi:manganese/zinc/iron transport system permease protein